MSQQTTAEFSARLRMAVDAHPRAPSTPFGRQSWLRDRLEKEAGIKVSANAVHKWMSDQSRPRGDNIRALARLLNVDEVWLTLGRTPNSDLGNTSAGQSQGAPTGASAETLILAGLLQAQGSNIVFAPREDTASLYLDSGRGSTGLIVVSCTERDGSLVAVIPEPAGAHKVLTVIATPCDDSSACVNVYDLTSLPRQNFGGYSVLGLARRKDGRLKADGERGLLKPVQSLVELA